MKIQLNGEGYETASRTISGLLGELQIAPGRVAVEVNLKIIRKADFERHQLHEGDSVEVVNFVGGG